MSASRSSVRPTVNERGEMFGGMLQRSCSFKINIQQSEYAQNLNNGWPLEIHINDGIEQRKAVALAMALSIDSQKPTSARWRATIAIDPLHGIVQNWIPSSASLAGLHMITQDEINLLNDHFSIVSTSNIKKIEIAIARFISDSVNRADPQDSLIDAVIGLESLFGGRAEIALSVASGVANILGETTIERKDYFKLTKEIYDVRSKLVHGSSKNIKRQEIFDYRKEVIDLLKQCILKLLTSRPELIPLTAQERVKELVLS